MVSTEQLICKCCWRPHWIVVGDEANERPTSDIPRTVASTGMDRRNRRISLRESVSLIMTLFKHNETVVAV